MMREDSVDKAGPSPESSSGGVSQMALRLLPLFLLGSGMAAAWSFGVLDLVSFDQIYQQRTVLQTWVVEQGVWAAILYGGVYALVIAFSLPLGLPLTVIAGFLFGPVGGAMVVACGATAGATIIFLVARTALGESLRRRAGPLVARLQDGFEKNAWSYMLVLRLVPAFPFWLVNIVPAILGVRLWTYVWTTGVGILPATLVFTLFGSGLDSVFQACDLQRAQQETDVCALPPVSDILTLEMMAALLALALLALLPMVYDKVKRWRVARLD